MKKEEIKKKIIEILREFDYANTDLEPEKTTIIEKEEASLETEKEYAGKLLDLFCQEKQKQQEELTEIFSIAWQTAYNKNQTIGEKRDLYITLEQLDEILLKFSKGQ